VKPTASGSQLANSLRELRARSGLTQAQLAERVGVTRKTINTVENRVFVPSTILALKLAEALEVTVEEVFRLED
jgi:putative transcriptional regulator